MTPKDVVLIAAVAIAAALAITLFLVYAIMPLLVFETLNVVEREFSNITVGCSSEPGEGKVEIDLNGFKQYCKLRRVEKGGERLVYYR